MDSARLKYDKLSIHRYHMGTGQNLTLRVRQRSGWCSCTAHGCQNLYRNRDRGMHILGHLLCKSHFILWRTEISKEASSVGPWMVIFIDVLAPTVSKRKQREAFGGNTAEKLACSLIRLETCAEEVIQGRCRQERTTRPFTNSIRCAWR